MSKSIIIVDHNLEEADLVKVVLESTDFGYRCESVDSLDRLTEILKSRKVDIVLIDKDFPEDGMLRKIKKYKLENRHVRMIMLADHLEEKDISQAREHYIEGFCQKNDDYPTLINTIEEVVE